MGANHPHLIRRGAVYYYRRRLPPAVSRTGQIVISLRTCDPYAARRLARTPRDTIADQVELICMNVIERQAGGRTVAKITC